MDGDGSSGRLIGSEIHGFHTLQGNLFISVLLARVVVSFDFSIASCWNPQSHGSGWLVLKAFSVNFI